MNNEDLTLFTIGDKNNAFSLRKSIESYIKHNNNNVVVVNTQQNEEVSKFSSELGVTVVNLNKKFGYPMYTFQTVNLFIESLFEVMLRPSLQIKTKYFIWSEPDAFFYNKITIDQNIFDLVSPCFLNTKSKSESGRWVFHDYWYLSGLTDEERDNSIHNLLNDFNILCEGMGLDWQKSVEIGFIFNFYPGSIVNTKKFQNLLITHENKLKLIIKNIFFIIEKHCTKYTKNVFFGWDIILSICLTLFQFKWISCKTIHAVDREFLNINDEHCVNSFVKNNNNISFLHPIKIYYKN